MSDLQQFESQLRLRAEEAARRTNERLDGELAQLTRLTRQDLDRLLPRKADKVAFAKLKLILDEAAEDNVKQAVFLNNAQELAGVCLRLLKLVL